MHICGDLLIICGTDQTFIYSRELALLSVLNQMICDFVHAGELYCVQNSLKKITLQSAGINGRL